MTILHSPSQSLPRIVFFGNERLSTGLDTIKPQVLPTLIKNGFEILAVATNNQASARSSKRLPEVEQVARLHNIPIFSPKHPLDLLTNLENLKPEVGVLVAYGRIVPQAIIDRFPYGIINIHPSLLPLYRGSTPIEQVILDGQTQTGVSIMGLTSAMDAGPIYAQTKINLLGNEQKSYLAKQLLSMGTKMIIPLLRDINQSLNNFSTQDNNLATYSPQIKKSDGLIDWGKPATFLEREIRAYLGWPGSYTSLAGKDIIITSVTILNLQGEPGTTFRHGSQLGIFTSQNALIINRLKPAGKREMTGQEFLAGRPQLLL